MKKFLGIIGLISLLLGCASLPERYAEEATKTLESQEGQIRVVFLSEEELLKRFGRTENPYVNYPGKFPPRNFVVFEAILESGGEELFVKIPEITLALGEAEGEAFTERRLKSVWNFYYKDDKRANLLLQDKVDEGIPHISEISVMPGEVATFLLVFLEEYPVDGNGVLRMPLVIGGETGTIEFEYDFKALDE